MRRRALVPATAAIAALLLAAGCSGDDSGGGGGSAPRNEAEGPVTLDYWAWAPNISKVVDIWNAENPDIQVKVNESAQGDDLVTKVLTAHRAGNGPDLVQAEYQALPSLVVADVAADISQDVEGIADAFTEDIWQLTTFDETVYAVPQDLAPMMLYYRQDLFDQMGLQVPTTWDEFRQVAEQVQQQDPKLHLTTFSSEDPGWFAGLSQQAGAEWWTLDGSTWTVGIDDEPTQQVADYWGDLVADGLVLGQPMYTPQWNAQLNDGSLLAWPSAIWGPAVLEGIAPDTRGKWAMTPLPAWESGDERVGFWGGSSTAVTTDADDTAAAAEFAAWLNTDPEAVQASIRFGNLYPASTDGQSSPALDEPPAFLPNQPDFFEQVADIAASAQGFTWGPNVNVTYSSYRDAFAEAIQDGSPFTDALAAMQDDTLADMEKSGYEVSGG
jgi:multiple sugar transport system substrate-binding protein